MEWDQGHQLTIVETASPGTEEARLEEYRRRRDRILFAFSEAWTALALVGADPSVGHWESLAEKSRMLMRLIEELK